MTQHMTTPSINGYTEPTSFEQTQSHMPHADSLNEESSNPFIRAATPLLTMMVHVTQSDLPQDIEALHQQIVNEITLYRSTLTSLRLEPRQIDASCYCLCTALDEAILNTPWGTSTLWSQHSLLSYFHQETWGGERFYTILEAFANYPRAHVNILEFINLLLSLGYEGQFFDSKIVIREEVRSRVFQRIKALRGKVSRLLSPRCLDLTLLKKGRHNKTALKKLCLASIACLVIANGYYSHHLHQSTQPQIKLLQDIGRESPITAYSQLLDRSITDNN